MRRRGITKKQLILKRVIIILSVIFALILALTLTALIMTAHGKKKLKGNANTDGPVMENVEDASVKEKYSYEWQEGWVSYNGSVYEYNDDIRTFLILGIDPAHQEGNEELFELTNGGQSDGIFLVIVNPTDESIKILAVNRDTQAEIVMVGIGEGGTDIITKSQITNQHGFGGGKEYSCELTRDAVSKLLYNVPIHGYMSIDYRAIPKINDAVGGVEITMNDDFSAINKNWTQGSEVLLKGEDAYDFVHYRNTDEFESQRKRLSRQKTYLTGFVKNAKAKTKEDITLPITLYNDLKDYMVTDLTVDAVGYMATNYLNYDFEGDNIYTMEGETVLENDGYEHFYPDEEMLKELILSLYYKKIK